jgi:ferrous iron transport protein A
VSSTSIPLCSLKTDQTGIIRSLLGGHALTSRLATLGFTPGTELTMVQNYGWGPLIVQVRDTRIALGRGEARKIHVTHAAPPPQPSEAL